MINFRLKSLKHKIAKALNPEAEFTKRIKLRYATFWGDDFAGNVQRLPLMHTQDPMSVWTEADNWQRLLENKHNSREFAKKHGCRVPDLYWQGRDFKTLDFEGLPHQYVIRPTVGHSAKLVYLMKGNTNLFDGCTHTKEAVMAEMYRISAESPDTEFLCEEFLADENGTHRIPDDYKFYMFNGEVSCIQVLNRFGLKKEGVKGTAQYYDEGWNMISKIKKSAYAEGRYQAPPRCLPEMISYAKTLSKAYRIFVRVDLYATDKGAVFGEFCPTPARGYGFTTFGSKLLVSKWEKHCKGLI